MFVLFVDLCKTFDTVPWQGMRKALGKYGIPLVMVELLKSLYENMVDCKWYHKPTDPSQ